VIIMQINTSYIAATWWQRHSRNSTRSFFEQELANLLLVFNWPDMDWWSLSRLTRDHGFSVCTNVKRENVVSVEFAFVSSTFGFRWNLFTSIVSLSSSWGVHNNTEGSRHKDNLAVCSVAAILIAVRCAVAINVFNFPLRFRLLRIESF
jgi:hypothetical protein